MKIDRRVVARKDQLLVAIPARVRDHLGVVGSTRVWWHIGRRGQVALTVTGRLKGGEPREPSDCASCAKYRDELDRLRRELRERDAATPTQFWRQGYMRALGDAGNVKADLEFALVLLKQIAGDVRHSQPRRRSAGKRATRAVETLRGPDDNPPPDPSLSPVLVGGGADTSGAAPPGVPTEHS